MMQSLTIEQLDYALGLLQCAQEEHLRKHPERSGKLDMSPPDPNDPADAASIEFVRYLEELGDDTARELLAIMYLGREGGTAEQWRRSVQKDFPDAVAAAAQIKGKGPALRFIAVGLARMAGEH